MCILFPLSLIFICTFAEDRGAIKSNFINQALLLSTSYVSHTKYLYIADYEGIWWEAAWLQKRILFLLGGYSALFLRLAVTNQPTTHWTSEHLFCVNWARLMWGPLRDDWHRPCEVSFCTFASRCLSVAQRLTNKPTCSQARVSLAAVLPCFALEWKPGQLSLVLVRAKISHTKLYSLWVLLPPLSPVGRARLVKGCDICRLGGLLLAASFWV